MHLHFATSDEAPAVTVVPSAVPVVPFIVTVMPFAVIVVPSAVTVVTSAIHVPNAQGFLRIVCGLLLSVRLKTAHSV